ncbi:MAG: phosphate acyltransferase PlsX [Verrucomicrobia bacterium]|nr:phosphate acyltransferase PlsX [Verrucomicrobiota bacterium]
MRIAVDVMGGDHGPGVVIDGVKIALENDAKITELFLVGKEDEIHAGLKTAGCHDRRVRVVHASEVLTMEDKPVEALRKKKDSSILRAVDLVRDGTADAIISQGNTGGLVVSAHIRLRPLPGVERPAIACIMPRVFGEWVLLDAGANPEATPLHLAHNAVMGAVYYRSLIGGNKPRVGIICNGSEEIKGNDLTREALRLCKQLDLNFVGYVEGPDLFQGKVDVAVADGFVGNIVLKTIEGMGKGIQEILKSELTATPLRKLGAMIAKDGLRGLKRRMNPDCHGGAQVLGLNGNVIKVHGSAKAVVIANAVRQTGTAFKKNLNQLIAAEIAKANERLQLPAA